MDYPPPAFGRYVTVERSLTDTDDDAVLSYIQWITDDHKSEYLKKLQSQNNVDEIESATKTQSNHFDWFKYRKYSYTASLWRKCGKNCPKNLMGLLH